MDDLAPIAWREWREAYKDKLPCDHCELESGCIVQPFSGECEDLYIRLDELEK